MNKKQLAEQLGVLVGFRTLPDNAGELNKGLNYIESLISSKASVKRIVNNGKEILLAGSKETNKPKVAFVVHLDVVAGRDEQFDMERKGDKVFGRGVSDMKFSIPIGVALLNEIIEMGSGVSFTLAVTTDEETGGYDGAAFLAKEKILMPEVLIVPDGGDNFVFVEKAKGVCQVIVEAAGKPAHASRPWMGKNALEPVVVLVAELLKKYGDNNRQESWKTTMNIGVIQGGISTNQVCDQAVVKLDFRYPETESSEAIATEVKQLAAKISGDIKVSPGSVGMPTFTDVDSKVVKQFMAALDAQAGVKMRIDRTYGASDARHWAKTKAPVLMTKPVGGEIHSENEWISLESCMSYYQGVREFLLQLK